MHIHNLWEDEAGESHFRDIEIEFVEERNFSKLSRPVPVADLIFRETSGDYNRGWHVAPRRQYIINLDGGVRITASDGESRELQTGEVLLIEDVNGKGHLTETIDGQSWSSIFVAIE